MGPRMGQISTRNPGGGLDVLEYVGEVEQCNFSIESLMEERRSFGAVFDISLTSSCACLFILSMEGVCEGCIASDLGSLDAQGPIHLPGMIVGFFFLDRDLG